MMIHFWLYRGIGDTVKVEIKKEQERNYKSKLKLIHKAEVVESGPRLFVSVLVEHNESLRLISQTFLSHLEIPKQFTFLLSGR